VEWLGDVPEHWQVKAIKWTTPVFRGASPRPIDDPAYFDDEGEYAWVRIADVTASNVYLEETTQRLSDIGSSLSVKMQPGSLFLSIAGTVGMPCITNIKCCIHDGFVYFPRSKSDTKFMYYIFACGEPYKGLGKMGTQLNLNTDTVGSIVMGFPPLPEQQAIAAFLDRETSRIDSLIGKKKKLVELLAEQRTALISRAVTKGLDAGAKLKPSGVEWLGEVPEHWGVFPLKRIVAIPVTDGPHETPEIFDEGIPFVSAEAIRNNKIDFDRKRGFISESEHRRFCLKYHPKRNDIFMIKSGATTGNLAIVETDEEFSIWSPLAVIRVHQEKALASFVLSAMNSKEFQTSVQLFWSFGTQQNIGMNVIENLSIPLPPLPEQQAIAAFLDRETARIDTLVSKVEKAIDTLKEYRTALISAAVTGKIDVREAAV
jgi:type I restriction enzyme S subunit